MGIHSVFSDNIRALAKKRGLSINHLADFAGISRGYLSTILRGQKSPTLRTVEKIAEALEVEVGELLKD
jgi:transcriptional regulator with XRE-family HTH domain